MNPDTAADDAEKTSLSPFSVAALVVGGFVSAAWLVISYVYLIHSSGKCTYWALDCFEKVNEWGDFFAGTFSPLAFVWLVVAVILQSMELREQRRELALTRAEFAQNRTVAQAQADESRRQAQFIGEQTKLLQDQEHRYKAEDAESVFDAALQVLAATLINYDHVWTLQRDNGTIAVHFRLGSYRNDSDRRVIIAVGQELRKALRELNKTERGGRRDLLAEYPYDFARTLRVLSQTLDAYSALAGRSRSLAQSLELEALSRNINALVQRSPTLQAALADPDWQTSLLEE
ncbi:hypothetical protein ELH97_06310 [Rhizobium leguminosarum]|uniref:hypothetical protein n=1 Tax=Rhizobium leguminosarum TaxID=384 RepID=UPI0010309C4A|nr:hypothetical protein [Rhizobium leguminosarum]TAX91560.1 hypothetical protein ELH97_06310 [Rhizobium leguminosarum]